LLLLLPSK